MNGFWIDHLITVLLNELLEIFLYAFIGVILGIIILYIWAQKTKEEGPIQDDFDYEKNLQEMINS